MHDELTRNRARDIGSQEDGLLTCLPPMHRLDGTLLLLTTRLLLSGRSVTSDPVNVASA